MIVRTKVAHACHHPIPLCQAWMWCHLAANGRMDIVFLKYFFIPRVGRPEHHG